MTYHTFVLSILAGLIASPAAFADPDKDESGHGRRHGHKHKEEFWVGNCKIKREWKKDGEYKEERKCKRPEREYEHEARRPVRVVPAQPVVVYPPWIVVQQEERSYHPQYQPRYVSGASRCNSDTAGRVLGGIVGGALGNQIGKGGGRTVATIGGAVAGVLIGGEIGKRMDAADQGCVGQVLEVAPVDRPVQWMEGPAQYVVVPGQVVNRQGSYCRPYTVEVTMDGRRERSKGVACRRGDGVWVAA
jgi:surface antigen